MQHFPFMKHTARVQSKYRWHILVLRQKINVRFSFMQNDAHISSHTECILQTKYQWAPSKALLEEIMQIWAGGGASLHTTDCTRSAFVDGASALCKRSCRETVSTRTLAEICFQAQADFYGKHRSDLQRSAHSYPGLSLGGSSTPRCADAWAALQHRPKKILHAAFALHCFVFCGTHLTAWYFILVPKVIDKTRF